MPMLLSADLPKCPPPRPPVEHPVRTECMRGRIMGRIQEVHAKLVPSHTWGLFSVLGVCSTAARAARTAARAARFGAALRRLAPFMGEVLALIVDMAIFACNVQLRQLCEGLQET